MNPKQVRIEELLKYCDEVGIDDQSLKFTQPDYYIDHVLVSTYDNEKIKAMMHSVDRSAMNLHGSERDDEDDANDYSAFGTGGDQSLFRKHMTPA